MSSVVRYHVRLNGIWRDYQLVVDGSFVLRGSMNGYPRIREALRNAYEDYCIHPSWVDSVAVDSEGVVWIVLEQQVMFKHVVTTPTQNQPHWQENKEWTTEPDADWDLVLEAEKDVLTNCRKGALSMHVSYWLRGHSHRLFPDTVDSDGSVEVESLLKLVGMTREELVDIVDNFTDKRRYAFRDGGKRVVALNGVTKQMKADCPDYYEGQQLTLQNAPEYVYHATTEKNSMPIMHEGLKSFGHVHVHATRTKKHLPPDTVMPGEARVGIKINLHAVLRDKIPVFLTEAGVYLIENAVPANHIAKMAWDELIAELED